ncbi:MAG: DUF881 domain-containing protein [Anaerolineae bacterium]|nr:DUF881 domain-containing protein [Anaerolineae bacterium]
MASSQLSRTLLRSLSLIALGAFLGLLLAQGLTDARPAVAPAESAESQPILDLVARLEEEQAVLRQGVETRRRALARAAMSPEGGAMLDQLERELLWERQLAGLTEIEGPGLEIVLADGGRPAHAGEEPETFIVHDYDLRDLINALWSAGAEAVCVGEERIAFGTYVYCVGSTIVVGEKRVTPPLTIRAVGDAEALERMLNVDPELSSLRQRVASRAVRMAVHQRDMVWCPAYVGAISVRFARIGE